MRLEGDHVVVGQILESVGQRLRERSGPRAADDEIEELLLDRQVHLPRHGKSSAFVEVVPGQPKLPVQRSLFAHRPLGGNPFPPRHCTRAAAGPSSAEVDVHGLHLGV